MLFNSQKAFFVIDSNNLEGIETHLYGYTFIDGRVIESSEGLEPEKLEGDGSYVHVACNPSTIAIRQDFMGSYGLCIYRNGGGLS